MRNVALFGLAGMLLATTGFAGAQKDKKAKSTHVMTCPMSGEAVKDSKITGVYGAYTVHFCCKDCKPSFDKLSKKDQQAKIQAMLAKGKKKTASAGEAKTVVDVCPITGEKVKGEGGGTSVVGKYEVHFCCAGCKPSFDQLTMADKEKKIADALKKG